MSVLGPELVANGDFSVENIGSEWTYGTDWVWSAGSGGIAGVSAGIGVLSQTLSVVSGKSYQVIATTSLANGATGSFGIGGGSTVVMGGGGIPYTMTVVAGSSHSLLQVGAVAAGGTQQVLLDNLSYVPSQSGKAMHPQLYGLVSVCVPPVFLNLVIIFSPICTLNLLTIPSTDSSKE